MPRLLVAAYILREAHSAWPKAISAPAHFQFFRHRSKSKKQKLRAKPLRFLRYLLFKNLNIKEFEQNHRRLVGGLDRSYSRRARRAKSRGAALSQKHAKQTKDVPSSPFQFFSKRSEGKKQSQ
jgi:hypothetical protein